MRARNEAIWPRVTGWVGQNRRTSHPPVIPREASQSISARNGEPAVSLNVAPAVGDALAKLVSRTTTATRATRSRSKTLGTLRGSHDSLITLWLRSTVVCGPNGPARCRRLGRTRPVLADQPNNVVGPAAVELAGGYKRGGRERQAVTRRLIRQVMPGRTSALGVWRR